MVPCMITDLNDSIVYDRFSFITYQTVSFNCATKTCLYLEVWTEEKSQISVNWAVHEWTKYDRKFMFTIDRKQ